jgi:hypothetical protein
VPHTSTAEQGGPFSHMQPVHETILTKDISMPPLQAVPPTVTSCASMRSKSKIAPQISFGHVASFLPNLKGQALARQSTTFVGPHRPMLSPDVDGVPTNNTNNGNKCRPPVRALGWARHPREDGPRKSVTKQIK